MTDEYHITQILQELSPLEILELCNLHEDPHDLCFALGDHIEENLETIEENLKENGLLDEEED